MLHSYRKILVPFLTMIAVVTLLFKLGWWQLEQKQRKELIVARIEQRAGAAPLNTSVAELAVHNSPVDDLDYTPVALKGRFIHESEVAVFTNRELGSSKHAGPGYDILTLFEDQKNGLVLINRGFVPQQFRQSQNRPLGEIKGNIQITGLIRKPERHSYVDVPDRPDRSEFAVRDPKIIIAAKLTEEQKQSASLFIDDFYIDLRTPVPEGELPSPNKTTVNLPNRHLEYVITWWGLALVFIGMFGVFLRQRFKQV